MTPAPFSRDIREFLAWLSRHGARYVIVGGEAVIYYGHARLTGDIDIFYDRSPENCRKLHAALSDFWQGCVPGIDSPQDLQCHDLIIQFGMPPHRIDLLSSISAVEFSQAWDSRVIEQIKLGQEKHPIYFIGLDQLIRNKKSVMRPRDSEDLEFLEKIAEPNKKRGTRKTTSSK